MRPRLLPLLIAVAVVTLGLRLGGLWQGIGSAAEAGGQAQAAEVAQTMAEGEEDEQPAAAEPETAAGDEGTSLDPFAMTDEEIELLQELADRRKELDRRQRELDRRADLLKAAEARIDDKIAELKALRESIEQLVARYDKENEQRVERLVNIYESMKPDDAARIFEDLDMPVLLRVLGRMSERKSAPILAEMNAERAQAVTLELAEQRELPLPRK